MKSVFQFLIIAILSSLAISATAQQTAELVTDVTVVRLAQTEGQYETTSLSLEPGKYIFEVTNTSVEKGLGFFLTPASDAKAQVANSGLSKLVNKGETARTGVVTLTNGTYQYSCPLNPTPHYKLTVGSAK
ncbi:MAG: hypothetical protein AAFQ02_12445 [Bacteroidota bacterium]